MTYQGERARPMASEVGRLFEVSQVRVDIDGHVSDVVWSEVDARSDRNVGPGVTATALEVIDAIHDGAVVVAVFGALHLPERAFVVAERENGQPYIALIGPSSPGRNLADVARLNG